MRRINACAEMISEARRIGISVMLGCMTESSVGISALAQLAPFADAVDMDGVVLLAKDVVCGVGIEKGKSHYPTTPGSGGRPGSAIPGVGGTRPYSLAKPNKCECRRDICWVRLLIFAG